MEAIQTEEEAVEVETRVVVTAIRSLVVAAVVVVAVAAVAVVAVMAATKGRTLTPLSSIGEESRMQKRVSWNEGHTSAAGKSPVPM